jgi:transcription termination factor Rho
VRPPKDNEKFFSLLRVEAVNGVDPETARKRPSFDTLTPIFPLELIDLETQPNILSTRVLNLVAPTDRSRSTWTYRFAAESRQDVAAQVDCKRHLHQQP